MPCSHQAPVLLQPQHPLSISTADSCKPSHQLPLPTLAGPSGNEAGEGMVLSSSLSSELTSSALEPQGGSPVPHIYYCNQIYLVI